MSFARAIAGTGFAPCRCPRGPCTARAITPCEERAPMSSTQFDVAEVLTELARNAAAEAQNQGRVLLFDYEGALAVADGPVEELRSLLHHALAHMLRRCEEGCVFFGAEVHR